jgi:hypothetical protein
MSEEFKRKLESYEKGELSGAELEAFEQELAKLEAYQEYLQENGEPNRADDAKQVKILRRGKWKARFQTALTALSLFIVFTIVSGILTNVYYAWGKPNRVDVYRNIIDHTLTITDPYGYLGGTSTGVKPYFGLEATRPLSKVIGHERFEVGELHVNFLFSFMTQSERKFFGRTSQDRPSFRYPGAGPAGKSDWPRLEALPEGTVVSAYVSFSRLMETQDVLDAFEGKNMDLVWLAVDTGIEADDSRSGIPEPPIGFPSSPIWHEDDFIVKERKEEKRGWFGGKTVSQIAVSPEYETGDPGVLQQQFMKTLEFLARHERMANKLVSGRLQLAERLDYLREHGFHHYGVVITGPTKELLKLRNEAWVAAIEVDEAALWNWTSANE